MEKGSKKNKFIFSFLIFGILFLGFVYGVQWIGSDVIYHAPEDIYYIHNLSKNVSGFSSEITFTIDTQPINWTNASGTYAVSESDVSKWIRLLNSTTGNFTINATYDNQSGFFVIPIQANNASGDDTITDFEFQINATNDYPEFSQIETHYNWSHNENEYYFLNGTDEEEHYPLNFSVNFNSTCTHASWSGRAANENCSLFDFGFNVAETNNLSSMINFTPSLNDVGTYYANISITDFNGTCPHSYCDSSTYEENKTTYYSEMVVFNIKANLEINASDCENKILNESQEFTCEVNITTPGESDSLSVVSNAELRNYADDNILNTSWFYALGSTSSSNFIKTVSINVTPSKNEVGNWSINLSVFDLSEVLYVDEEIFLQVNKNDSLEVNPVLSTISDVETSSDLETTINFEVFDNDLLIPDKNDSFGGYEETITFYLDILTSNSTVNETFNVVVDSMPVVEGNHFTNKTTAHVTFTPDSNETGTYSINLTIGDKAGTNVSQVFEIVILDNHAPQWDGLLNTSFLSYENGSLYLNLSLNASDSDNDALTFSYSLDDYLFPSMNMTNLGIVNMTFNDSDVGEHIVSISVSDGYLSNLTSFNFTVLNLVDDLSIIELDVVDALIAGDDSEINISEDDEGKIYLRVNDYDLLIPSNQSEKGFYNESFDFTISFVNYSSMLEVDLFNFTENREATTPTPFAPEDYQTRFDATFTPGKEHIGKYNVTINITDQGNASDLINFNLTINDINHAPVLDNLTNQTTGINRTWTYDINSTDVENGNDSSGNLVYSYNFLEGNDFISNNESLFNTSSGIFNLNFNSTHGGKYRINVTVNDSENLFTYDSFYLFVYDIPEIIFPSVSESFSLVENVSTNIIYSVNHSVLDDLTYLFYIENGSESFLKQNVTAFGNSTNNTWSFAPNFTDETYGEIFNLTMVAYPSNENLINSTDYNVTYSWDLVINHTNHNLTQSTSILDAIGGSPQVITLSNYFTDYDASDSYYNQSVRFVINSISGSGVSSSVINWVDGVTPSVTFTASSNSEARFSVTAYEYNSSDDSQILSNVTSNEFDVQLTISSPAASSSSSTRTVTKPVSLRLIMPDPISAFKKEKIVLPISLFNDGEINLKGIDLSGLVLKDNVSREDFNMTFSQIHFDTLLAGEEKNFTLTIDIDTESLGLYEITVLADIDDPEYKDWGKFYLTIEEDENVQERLLFTEEFVMENPECIELTELVNSAKDLLESGEIELAMQKINQAVDACKVAISQTSKLKEKAAADISIYLYVFGSIAGIFILTIISYFYRRMKLSKASLDFEAEKLKKGEKESI
ncbi:hypothetical protein HOD88_03600 [archaeon]|jgi:hypothetical protein|nr:hypothetical protein [archaeon]